MRPATVRILLRLETMGTSVPFLIPSQSPILENLVIPSVLRKRKPIHIAEFKIRIVRNFVLD